MDASGNRLAAPIAALIAHAPPEGSPMAEMRHINVIDQQGGAHRIEGLDGWQVMEVIRDQGLPIKAECGGACACATCHVYVDEAWLGKLAPQHAEEIAILDGAFEVKANSRLSCQILLRADLEGLSVTLAPGSEP
jgi:2Fe-2S ferredoxin